MHIFCVALVPWPCTVLRTKSGDLAYIDFGLVSEVPRTVRESIVCALMHLIHGEYAKLAESFTGLALMRSDDVEMDLPLLVEALREVFEPSNEALAASRKKGVNRFQNFTLVGVVGKLVGLGTRFPFVFNDYFLNNLRCLAILEGLALNADPNFNVLSVVYPHVVKKILTDPVPRYRRALESLLIDSYGRIRWSRMDQLLQDVQDAAATSETMKAASKTRHRRRLSATPQEKRQTRDKRQPIAPLKATAITHELLEARETQAHGPENLEKRPTQDKEKVTTVVSMKASSKTERHGQFEAGEAKSHSSQEGWSATPWKTTAATRQHDLARGGEERNRPQEDGQLVSQQSDISSTTAQHELLGAKEEKADTQEQGQHASRLRVASSTNQGGIGEAKGEEGDALEKGQLSARPPKATRKKREIVKRGGIDGRAGHSPDLVISFITSKHGHFLRKYIIQQNITDMEIRWRKRIDSLTGTTSVEVLDKLEGVKDAGSRDEMLQHRTALQVTTRELLDDEARLRTREFFRKTPMTKRCRVVMRLAPGFTLPLLRALIGLMGYFIRAVLGMMNGKEYAAGEGKVTGERAGNQTGGLDVSAEESLGGGVERWSFGSDLGRDEVPWAPFDSSFLRRTQAARLGARGGDVA